MEKERDERKKVQLQQHSELQCYSQYVDLWKVVALRCVQ